VPKSKVQYTVDLSAPAPIEGINCDIAMRPGGKPFPGLCALLRFGKVVTTFMASSGQRKKIRRGKGTLHITTAMIASSPLGR
jgi:hypothetical protein